MRRTGGASVALIASSNGRGDSVTVNQDVSLFASIMDAGESVEYSIDSKRYGWLQVARGAVEVNGEQAGQGDGIVIVAESSLAIRALEPSELLLFDLA